MTEQQFLDGCKLNKIDFERVDAKYPYNYNENKAYQAVNKNGLEMYFFFNDDGKLLQRGKIDKDGRFWSI